MNRHCAKATNVGGTVFEQRPADSCSPSVSPWALTEPQWRFIGNQFAQDICQESSNPEKISDEMSGDLPKHIEGLFSYLSQTHEKANEDKAIQYFRHLFGDEKFKRQHEAKNADGWVAGHFVLELKGDSLDWHAGLIQGLAYHKRLDFAIVVVAAHGFLAMWRVDSIPKEIRDDIENEPGSPSEVGKRLAARYRAKGRDRTREHLALAMWTFPPELLTSLFSDQKRVLLKIREFETILHAQQLERLKITPENFTNILGEMKPYFQEPLRTVRAFFSMIFGWGAGSRLELSPKHADRATLGGEMIEGLIPDQRDEFKVLVEKYAVHLTPNERYDDFFSRYDRALDTVVPDFRKQHGIFFTDTYLSKFVLSLTKKHVPDLGKNYLVIDPACGSGNLVTNWRAPLELRHKVVSEIEPELLFAIEQRMEFDTWHKGRFTVIPKVSENRGLNFLDVTAKSYLGTLTKYLKDSGHKPDKPIAFLCNPPYRNDDDQSVGGVDYQIDPTITVVTGGDGSTDRCSCFLAQMKLICRAAEDTGLPGGSPMLIFTKTGWLTDREGGQGIREEILKSFSLEMGVIVDSSEFFDVSGSFPIAFMVWKYQGNEAALSASRILPFTDLTWIQRTDLLAIDWSNENAVEEDCQKILSDKRSRRVQFGLKHPLMREWVKISSRDFKRSRRRDQIGAGAVGGLPDGDRREKNSKTYGDRTGKWVGFMDDLTPCRIDRDPLPGRPWFRLDAPFMDRNRGRCLSGPPDQKGFCAADPETTRRLFIWYAIQRTFAACNYPMWANAMQLWPPTIPASLANEIDSIAYAIGLARNDCVETAFPAGNPVPNAPAVYVSNPMSPVDSESFWATTCAPTFQGNVHPDARRVVDAVTAVYSEWSKELGYRPNIKVSYEKAYFVGAGSLSKNSGLVQIRDFAKAKERAVLISALEEVQFCLKRLHISFKEMLMDNQSLNYFSTSPGIARTSEPPAIAPVIRLVKKSS